MSLFFLDTSALVKRYFPEVGSAWIEALTDPRAGHTILVSELTRVEAAAAAAAKHRASGGISQAERDAAVNLLVQHCTTEYVMVPPSAAVLDRALELTQRYRLRGYDAVQLATALVVNERYIAAGFMGLTFITADDDLLAATRAEGLNVDDPNQHP